MDGIYKKLGIRNSKPEVRYSKEGDYGQGVLCSIFIVEKDKST